MALLVKKHLAAVSGENLLAEYHPPFQKVLLLPRTLVFVISSLQSCGLGSGGVAFQYIECSDQLLISKAPSYREVFSDTASV